MSDNNSTGTYINILIDTLKKKEQIIKGLLEASEKQASLLEEEDLDVAAFDETVEYKDKLLAALTSMDDGFLDVYSRVEEELKKDPAAYAAQVKEAQELVRTQTSLTTELTSIEERNKNKMAIQMTKGKQKIKDFKISSKTAAAYYKNMSGRHQDGDSYFFERRK